LRILNFLIDSSLSAKVMVNLVNLNGHSALSLAVMGGYSKDLVEKLLAAGADMNSNTQTALHWACRGGYEDIVRLLVDRGSNCNALDPEGNSPLLLAVQSGGGNVAVIRKLLSAGADVDFCFTGGRGSVLHWACEHATKAITEMLLQNNASCNTLNDHGETPFMVSCSALAFVRLHVDSAVQQHDEMFVQLQR
jgi:ankyrin repeat protein